MGFRFSASLKVGQVGETLFFSANCAHLKKEDGRLRDFSYKDSGEGIELKSDCWSMKDTPNFFMERWSNVAKQSPGGPWQSLANGTKYFIYFYMANLTYFCFEVSELCRFLDANIDKLEAKEVQNVKYTTLGYRVPRTLVEHLTSPQYLTIAQSAPLPKETK